MNRSKHYTAAALMFSLLGAYLLPTTAAYADDEPAAQAAVVQDTVRPEVGEPVKAVQALMLEKKYQEALDKLNTIDVPEKTPYENYVIERTRAAIAAQSGNNKLAFETIPRVIATGKLPPDEQLKFIEAMANLNYTKADYPETINWIQRYFKEGGKNPQEHDLLIRAYYLGNDFAHATEELQKDFTAEEKAGQAPTKTQLDILLSIAAKQNNKEAYVAAMEKYVTYYPRKDYWGDLLNRLQSRPNFPERLILDLYRLKLNMGLVKTSAEYFDVADLAMRAGYSAEAKKVLEGGLKAGILKQGPEYDKELGKATKSAAEDLKLLAQTEAEVKKNKDGLGLVNTGYTYVINDQFDKGLALMEQGLSSPNVKRLDEARLHLATAYVMAGRTENAVKAFAAVQGSDGTADLARYWALQLTHPIP